MNKLNFLIASILLIFVGAAFPQNRAPERDVQFWTDTQIIFPLLKKKDDKGKESDKLTFSLLGTFRAGRNVTHPVDERIGFGFDYQINKYLSFTPSYLYRAGQPFRGRKEFEHRLRFEVNAEKKWKNFSIKDRNRVEYRIRHSRGDSVRYRNKITLKVPVKKNGKEIFAPFVADEPFYDFREKAWTRNEFSAGISKKLSKSVSSDFFYLLQNNRGNSFKYVNVFGVNLKFRID